jgi:hypothetical protein
MKGSQALLLVLTGFVLGTATCGLLRSPFGFDPGVVLARFPSPDGSLEAVVTEDATGGATVPTVRMLFIVAKGRRPVEECLQLSAAGAFGTGE